MAFHIAWHTVGTQQNLTTEAPNQSLLSDGLTMNLTVNLILSMAHYLRTADYSQVFLDNGNAQLPRVSLLFPNLLMPLSLL